MAKDNYNIYGKEIKKKTCGAKKNWINMGLYLYINIERDREAFFMRRKLDLNYSEISILVVYLNSVQKKKWEQLKVKKGWYKLAQTLQV